MGPIGPIEIVLPHLSLTEAEDVQLGCEIMPS
jgi:hypothetical protein